MVLKPGVLQHEVTPSLALRRPFRILNVVEIVVGVGAGRHKSATGARPLAESARWAENVLVDLAIEGDVVAWLGSCWDGVAFDHSLAVATWAEKNNNKHMFNQQSESYTNIRFLLHSVTLPNGKGCEKKMKEK